MTGQQTSIAAVIGGEYEVGTVVTVTGIAGQVKVRGLASGAVGSFLLIGPETAVRVYVPSATFKVCGQMLAPGNARLRVTGEVSLDGQVHTIVATDLAPEGDQPCAP